MLANVYLFGLPMFDMENPHPKWIHEFELQDSNNISLERVDYIDNVDNNVNNTMDINYS